MHKLRTIEMQRLSVDEFHDAAKLPLVVVLDDVRSLHNVGSVFRSGDAFRIEAVYLLLLHIQTVFAHYCEKICLVFGLHRRKRKS